MVEHKFNYDWTLESANFTKDKGKVFSTFSCGGGSTMGYKLAGFDVIGNLEIDKKKNEAYVLNHHPKYNYQQDIREFRLRDDLPKELYELDILDGSPPCLAFSMVGDREKVWGMETKREGVEQAQTWDDLFFEQIALAKKLQPKVCICENVKGMLIGSARDYVRRINEAFEEAGYYSQLFLLNASTMGVPQKRERVFFVCLRKDLAQPFLYSASLFEELPLINMEFYEKPILYRELADYQGTPLGEKSTLLKLWKERKEGDKGLNEACKRVLKRDSFYSNTLAYDGEVCSTLTAHCDCVIPYNAPRYLSKNEVCRITSYPTDYNFARNSFHELCGRSVPPVMMAQIASRVYEQWLSKL